MAAQALGHLLDVHATPANEQERVQMCELCEVVQTVKGHTVELAWVDQGYINQMPLILSPAGRRHIN